MATYYVDLDISTTGAAGTEADPFGYDEWFGSVVALDEVFLKGMHVYTSDLVTSNVLFLKAWERNKPWRINADGFTLDLGYSDVRYAILQAEDIHTNLYTDCTLIVTGSITGQRVNPLIHNTIYLSGSAYANIDRGIQKSVVVSDTVDAIRGGPISTSLNQGFFDVRTNQTTSAALFDSSHDAGIGISADTIEFGFNNDPIPEWSATDLKAFSFGSQFGTDDEFVPQWARSRVMFSNIDDGNLTEGVGTINSPFNYNQLVNYTDPAYEINGEVAYNLSAIDGDIMLVHGAKTTDFVTKSDVGPITDLTVYLPFSHEISGSIEFVGTGPKDSYGSPCVFYNSTSNNTVLIAYDSTVSPAATHELSATFKNFIFDDGGPDTNVLYLFDNAYEDSTSASLAFKNCGFRSEFITQHRNGPTYNIEFGDISFYGCTIDIDVGLGPMVFAPVVSFFDTVIVSSAESGSIYDAFVDLQLDSWQKIVANENVTMIRPDLFDIGSPGDVTEYNNFIEDTSITQYDKKGSASLQVEYYYDANDMYYKNFNIPDGGLPDSFRIDNGYSLDFYNKTRLAYGAYSFTETSAEGRGHIGAFYFGGTYSNFLGPIDVPFLELFSTVSGASDVEGKGTPSLVLESPTLNVQATNSFPFCFSGVPREGGSPLTVDYHAFDYEPQGQFVGLWEATEFRWWFDFGTTSGANEYVSCATDRAEHTYCGFFGQEYDVRLCVIYSPIE